MTSKIPGEFYKLLPKFKEAMFVWPTSTHYHQKWNPDEDKPEDGLFRCSHRPLTDQDLANHFFLYPKVIPGGVKLGSYGVCGNFNRVCKWVVIDCDEEKIKEKTINEILPLYQKLGIEYIYEYGGDNNDRGHIWIKCDTIKINLMEEFFEHIILKQIKTTPAEFCEIFPLFRRKTMNLRLPYGPHLKRNDKRFAIEYKGIVHDDAISVMNAFIEMPPVTESQVIGWLKEYKAPQSVSKERQEINSQPSSLRQEFFSLQGLKEPIEEVPEALKPMVNNCPAINKMLKLINENNLLDDKTGIGHDAGLHLHSLAAFASAKSKTDDGENWYKWVISTKRSTSESSHNWEYYLKKKLNSPDRYIPRCKVWEQTYNACDGCPLKGLEMTPRLFYYGKGVTRKKLEREVKLTTPEEIRETTFKKASSKIKYLLENELQSNILMASSQGSGKSWWSDQVSADAAKDGKNVLIAVPTAKLALEHQKRLRAMGVDAFILSSHENIFGHQSEPPKSITFSDFNCPSYDEIQTKQKLGIPSSVFKKEFCSNCPLLEKCKYPNQYTEALDTKHKIIIIQHAHFKCTEVLYDLMRKRFSLLIIDEMFIENCFSVIRVNKHEISLLKHIKHESKFQWIPRFVEWLEGKEPAKKSIYPKNEELESLCKTFKASGLEWRVPELVRLYNQRRRVNPHTGIEVVYELPNIPIKVFTDATPPVELIEHMTGISPLSIYGENEIIDIKKLHPKNEVYQVLDNSISKTNLKTNFDEILHKIGELCEYSYQDKKILITTYKDQFDKVISFFTINEEFYPSVLKRITLYNEGQKYGDGQIVIDRMDRGTNDYEDFDVQFIVAGIFYSLGPMRLQVYNYRTVANYYKVKNNEKELQNIFPYEQFEEEPSRSGGGIEEDPIYRIEPINKTAGIFAYPQFKHYPFIYYWERLVYDLALAAMQQTNRIRMNKDKPRVVFILSNHPMPNILVTKSILYRDFLNLTP